jgi:cystathionine gamma-lyase
MSPHGDGTRAVRAGLPEPEQGRPFLPGPELAGPFALSGEPEDAEYVYGRYGNRTWTRVERAIGELEEGEALLFASGMAAVAAVLATQLDREAALIVPADGYASVRELAPRHHAGEVREVPTATLAEAALDGAGLVLAETPSNPGLEVCDLHALTERCRAAGATLAVDNTTPTPLGQRPLEIGADVSVASASKALSGHSDLVLGYVATRDAARLDALREWRRLAGGIAGPFEAWLLHRSLATLDVRLERQCANAQAIAELLDGRDEVRRLRYPGLSSDPGHATAVRQMSRFGPMVCFELDSRERAEAFLRSCELVTEATSFGGLHTTAERRGRWGGDDIAEGFVRLSAGCEETSDLLADIASAIGG